MSVREIDLSHWDCRYHQRLVDMNSRDFKIHEEHKEVGKDILSVIISYTPLSGIVDTIKFMHKWFYKKRGGHRVARFMNRRRRRFHMKYVNGASRMDRLA